MKKLFMPLLVCLLFLGLTQVKLNAQQRGPGEKHEFQRGESPFGEGFEIRKKMMDIERQTIESDPELKNLDQQIKTLQKQLNEKLQQKLSTNSEYQELKKKMEEMQKMWRERMKERQGEKED